MIGYLLISTCCMGVLLLFYHAVLERETIHHFKRGYLIAALIFSLIVPFLPFGMFTITTFWQNESALITIESLQQEQPVDNRSTAQVESGRNSNTGYSIPLSDMIFWSVLGIYLIVTTALFVRFIRLIHMIQLKAERHPLTLYEGIPVVLHNEKVVPYTFLRTVFVNRKQFQTGAVTEEMLRHELAHVRQLHSLDILFIELLKIGLWFNPVLYLYKKAMMLNHEFLADQSVLSSGASLASYQQLLFDALQLRAPHGLSSNFSFSITKKRFTMMTTSHSRFRSAVKMMLPVPLFMALALLFGCESTTSNVADVPEAPSQFTLEITENDGMILNGENLTFDELESYFSKLPKPPEIVHLNVSQQATFGLITDVQQVLRKNNALRITYNSTGPDIDEELASESDRLNDNYLDSVGIYLNTQVTDPQSLDDAYANMIQAYDSLKANLMQIPDAPPPPPLPPSPQERIDQETKEPGDVQPPAPPPPPVKARNLMMIRIDSNGSIFMNDNPVTIDDILPKLSAFIENPAGDSDLSESPKEAIVGIKTGQFTPYSDYVKTLDQVMMVYDQLRNKAALEQYGVSYSSLSDDSDRKQAIDSALPKRISIAEPKQ